MYVIAGLGNPGREYKWTRHNVGFMVADAVAELTKANIRETKWKAKVGQGSYRGEKLVLLKPRTYMNLSGESVAACLRYLRVKPENLVVIHDELDLPPGRVRVKQGGGPGGHKGVISIIERLGTRDFARVRVGIGKPEYRDDDAADFVLSPFSREETDIISEAVVRAAKAALMVVSDGTDKAMNEFNGPK